LINVCLIEYIIYHFNKLNITFILYKYLKVGFIQKDTIRTVIISYLGLVLGYLNKGVLFVLILSTEQIGLVNLILSVGILFSHLSNLGTINAVAKFAPFFDDRLNQKKIFFQYALGFVVFGVIAVTLLSVILQNKVVEFYSVKSSLFVDYYYWIIPIGIANVLFVVFETYLRSIFNNVLAVFLNDFVLRLSVTVLLSLLYFKVINFESFFVYHVLVYFIPTSILLLYLVYKKELSFKKSNLKIPSKLRKIILSYSLFSYTNTIGTLIVMTMDAMMIAYFLGLKATGVYTTVVYLTNALQIPFKSLMRISYPLVPIYWKKKDMGSMESLYKKTSSVSLIVALFMFSIVWININELFSFLPNDFNEGIWVFFFLMMGRIVDMYLGLNGWILITSKKYKFDMFFTGLLLFMVFGLNYLLIPIYGVVGAAISTGIAILTYNLARALYIGFMFKLKPIKQNQVFVLLVFSALLFLNYFIPVIKLAPIFSIIIKSILYSSVIAFIMIYFNFNQDVTDLFYRYYNLFFKRSK
jgi:O-antigen/teichoic acid export membrane protein